jgi:hypothetical protein
MIFFYKEAERLPFFVPDTDIAKGGFGRAG